MPDDKNMIAIFYGPVLLAFENGSELILKGTHQDILKGLKVQGNDYCSFTLRNGGQVYSLKPLYAIEENSYGVYATIRNY